MRPSRELLATLFENAPSFVERLANQEVASYEELLDRAEDIAGHMPEKEQLELIDGHPRIGAPPETVSASSFREQGYDQPSEAGDEPLADRLTRLNDEYERRFGFRFCVFVAGRPRGEIADLMEARMSASREDEIDRAMSDVIAIARDRLAKMAIAPEIISHYQRGGERERLNTGSGLIEFLRTQTVVRRVLPPPPAVVLDVGGGAGVHAAWLAAEGYSVRLFDPVPLHVAQAREAAAAQPMSPFSADPGEARDLPVDDGSADAVLLLGPLYHLVERADRLAALREARRALRPGGVLAAAAIGRYGDWLYGLQTEILDDPAFQAMATTSVRTGQHRDDDGKWFTTAYFHRPEELRDECAEAGFKVTELVALEGVAPLLGDRHERLAHPRRRRLLLDALELMESDPSIMGVSPHILAVARKPEELQR
jgi:2-oxo-4-hydroxy-4-carboxy--5-ureidoimidazoline (OHCU) decarboxylase/ubiquinone/menaquinone biosynthesis C-methylase UbiE